MGRMMLPSPGSNLPFDLIWDLQSSSGGRKLECWDVLWVPELVMTTMSTVIIVAATLGGLIMGQREPSYALLNHDSSVRQSWYHLPLNRWGNWGSQGLRNLLRITELVSGRALRQMQALDPERLTQWKCLMGILASARVSSEGDSLLEKLPEAVGFLVVSEDESLLAAGSI